MDNKAFTLIELLIVVLVIGILAELAIPRFSEAIKETKYSQAKVNMNAIGKALQEYYAKYGSYPPEVPAGVIPPGLVPEFLDKWPDSTDDPFNARYDYEAWPNRDGYVIAITYMGKNQYRDAGFGAYINQGIDGVPVRIKDDLFFQVATNAQINDDVDLNVYRRLGDGVYTEVIRR